MRTIDHLDEFMAELAPTVATTSMTRWWIIYNDFRDYLNKSKTDEPTYQTIRDYTAWMLAEGTNNRTIKYHHLMIRRFYRWVIRRGKGSFQPINPEQLPTLRVAKFERQPFTTQQYQKLLSVASQERRTYWTPALMLSWHTGMRISDVANLKWEDVNFDKETIKLVPWKTKRIKPNPIEIPMAPEICDMLRILKDRQKTWKSPYVVAELATSMQMDNKAPQQFKQLCVKAGMPELSFHSLRHSFITRAMSSGIDAHIVCALTGLSMKQIATYTHIGIDAKRDAIAKMAANQLRAV